MDRLTAAYAALPAQGDKQARRRARAAETFREDERMEQMIRLKARDAAAYDRMPPVIRMAVGQYEADKAAKAALEANHDDGNDG